MFNYLAQLAPAVIQTAGALFGANQAKKEARRAEARADHQRATQLQTMVEDAEKAGLNPASVLRSGASHGYAGTHTPTLSTSSFQIAGEGIANAFQSIFDNNPQETANLELRNELLRTQIENYREERYPIELDPRSNVGEETLSGTQLGNTDYEAGRRVQTWYAAPGSNWEPHPSAPDAQVVEDSLGEPASFIYSPFKIGLDIGHNIRRARDTIRSRWAIRNGGDNRDVWQPPVGWTNPPVRPEPIPSIHDQDLTEGW